MRLFPTIAFILIPAVAWAQPSDLRLEFFEKRVRPILVNNCNGCHSAETNSKGGLRVDDRNGLLTGGNGGAAIIPGKPADSNLIKRVTLADAKRRMPLEGPPLTPEQIADLSRWIAEGAVWPAPRVPASIGKTSPEYEKLKKTHWAFQPIRDANPPTVKYASWPRDPIDQFILAKLESRKLRPVGDANKVDLIRRVTFDLTGLPPTPQQVDAFLHDVSPGALATVVDRLLASPQFGERWGRHWLDVARYGESTGPSRNIPYPHAWKYRDYVIDSVNADVPYNRFVIEQIAGDLLPSKNDDERNRLLTATGFLALGVKDVNQRFKVRFIMDNVDEQIDVISRSILALTVSCARCHDHKFDPVPQTDYYALAGIFTSTDNCAGVRNKMGGGGMDYYDPAMLVRLKGDAPPPPKEKLAKLQAEFAQAKKEWDAIRGTPMGLEKAADGFPKQRPFRLKFEKLQSELQDLQDPASRGFVVHGVRDAKVIADTPIRVRGEAEKHGPVVPRGFLTSFAVPDAPKINTNHSGRLELAQWLTSPKNPLTARVIVNRVWHHLFGTGLVSTVDNFGVMGDTPSHPELLDHLATRFMRDGWSIKKLVRTIVLTRSYQLSSIPNSEFRTPNLEDPANRLIWRHTPRRLDSEEIRDASLASAGLLDLRRPTASPAKDLKVMEMPDNGAIARALGQQADRDKHRSVYLPLVRGVMPQSMEAFDPADQTLVTGDRDATTVPSQALFLLNSAFVRKNSLALAERLLKEPGDDSSRINAAYRQVLGREPTSAEISRVEGYLKHYEAEARESLKFEPIESTKQATVKDKPVPANPDEADQTGVPIVEERVRPKDARSAAWMSFVQALYGSAEFRYLK